MQYILFEDIVVLTEPKPSSMECICVMLFLFVLFFMFGCMACRKDSPTMIVDKVSSV